MAHLSAHYRVILFDRDSILLDNLNMMIPRNRQLAEIRDALTQFPVVAIVGARQIGKSTLARELASGVETAHVFDLEDPRDLANLADASAV